MIIFGDYLPPVTNFVKRGASSVLSLHIKIVMIMTKQIEKKYMLMNSKVFCGLINLIKIFLTKVKNGS